MAKRTRKSDEFDSPWKDALQDFLPAFIAFFFGDIHADIDWSRGYASLDKEFQKIARRAKVGKRLADKLFKVWLNDGSEHWLLIHIEIQGDYEKEFAKRMFDYNCAARQLYNNEIVSVTILCDDRADWRPTQYVSGRWGCEMSLTFRSAKLLDFADKTADLEANDNPFAAVVLAHCKTMETKRDPATRREWKLPVVKGLYRRHWSKEDIRKLFNVIDWIMTLPDDLDAEFYEEIDRYHEESKMEYISGIERRGMQKGREQGHRKGLVEGIALALDAKFGPTGLRLLRKVRTLDDVKTLRKFARFLKHAETLDEVREYLS